MANMVDEPFGAETVTVGILGVVGLSLWGLVSNAQEDRVNSHHKDLILTHFSEAVDRMDCWMETPSYLTRVRRIGISDSAGVPDVNGRYSMKYDKVYLNDADQDGIEEQICADAFISEDTFGNSYSTSIRVHHYPETPITVCVDNPNDLSV